MIETAADFMTTRLADLALWQVLLVLIVGWFVWRVIHA